MHFNVARLSIANYCRSTPLSTPMYILVFHSREKLSLNPLRYPPLIPNSPRLESKIGMVTELSHRSCALHYLVIASLRGAKSERIYTLRHHELAANALHRATDPPDLLANGNTSARISEANMLIDRRAPQCDPTSVL